MVQREWEAEQRQSIQKSLLDKLRSKYDIRVEGPAAQLFKAPSSQPGDRSDSK
jgi:hypothetical protein